MTYTFTCSQGHDPVSFSVEAETDDEALAKLKEQAGPHLAEAHPDMNMSPEEGDNLIRSTWVKS